MRSDKRKKNVFTVPNLLTYARIVIALLFIAAIFRDVDRQVLITAYLLVLVTDRMDGCLARRWKMESQFGERIETVADTFFTLAFLLFSVAKLNLPIIILLIFISLFLVGITAQLLVLAKNKKWFSGRLWPSGVSALITYLAGLFYLIDLPNKYPLAIFAVCFAAAACGYHLFCLYKFAKSNVDLRSHSGL